MEHLYHWGWDCVCAADPTPEGGFRAIVICKSLVNGHIQQSLVDGLVHETVEQSLRRAREVAVNWIHEHRYGLQNSH
jgi:hypothetical protein